MTPPKPKKKKTEKPKELQTKEMEPKNTETALEGRKRLRKCRTPRVEEFGEPNATVTKTEVQEPEETEETEEHQEEIEETKASLTSFLKPCAQVSSRPSQD